MGNRTYHPRGVLVDGCPVQRHPLYGTWAMMLGRCLNPTDPNFHSYGGRGIKVCERWHHFANFAEDMGAKPSPDLSIERMDNNAGYCPDNCVWGTRSDQCVNRRVFINNTSGFTGVTQHGRSWVARFDYENLRYNIGWFENKDEALAARLLFVEMFFLNREAALEMLPQDAARWTSQTGVRGITPHTDGGYTVRCTRNKVRHYLGYFTNFMEACDARSKFLAG